MGIATAMNTGVAGLKANSDKTGAISENIANANTVGYKRSFADMVTTRAGGESAAAGVEAVRRNEISRGGTPIATNSVTDLSISGDGFFVVSKNPNDPLESNYMLTRAGSFKPDADGNLRNAAGYYLAGYPYQDDGTIGVVDPNGFGGLRTVNTGDADLQAQQTTEVSVSGNLPAQETGLATPGSPFIASKSVFNPLGGSERVQLSWQPGTAANEWTLTMSDGNGTDYGSVDVAFNDSGPNAGSPQTWSGVVNLATAPANFAFDTTTGVAELTLDNGATPQVIDISLGAPDSLDGITQFNGDFTPQKFDIDGASVAGLSRTEIDENGDVIGVFENGIRRSLFQVPVGMVTNPDGLIREDGNAFRVSRESGDFAIQQAGSGDAGDIESNSLEGSNVDIATELTDLIATQRAYSSNATIVRTADEMLAETTQLKR